jgi:hypothetical protein
MNWIKQNPFLSALIVITIVLCGLLVFVAIKGGSKYEKAKKDYNSAYADVRNFEKFKLYPNKDNSQAKNKALEEYDKAIKDLSDLYKNYQLDPSKKITTQQFTGNVKLASEEVAKAFNATGGKLPENFFMGFESYKGQLAKTGSTSLLDYQLNAIKHILLGMAEAKPSELVRIYREKNSEENDVAHIPEKNDVARKFGYEIVFKGSEPAVRDFITKLGSKHNYYCVIRSIRINNHRDTPPRISDAKFETPKPPEAASPFGAFFEDPVPAPGTPSGTAPATGVAPAPSITPTPGVAPAPGVAPTPGVAPAPGAAAVLAPQPEGADDASAPPVNPGAAAPAPAPLPFGAPANTDTSRILYQVLGDEELEVFIRFDLLLFLPKPEPTKP